MFTLADTESVNPLLSLFEHVLLHRRLYTALLGSDGSARVMAYLLHRMTIAIHVNRVPVERDFITHRDDPLEAPRDVAAAFAAGALVCRAVN